MYPPNQSKVPPVRPRSSLSTDEHHHRVRDTHHRHTHANPTKHSNALLTLAGFCVFLFVLCSFLLGALVYVGRNIVDETATAKKTTIGLNVTDSEGNLVYAIPDHSYRQLLSSTNSSILRIRSMSDATTPLTSFATSGQVMKPSSVEPSIAAASKVLKHLSYRLPREIRPLHYQLLLQPDLGNKTFTGNVTIKLEVLQPISFLPVHAKKLNVSTNEVLQLGEGGAPVDKLIPTLSFAYPDLEYWVTEFTKPLAVGQYSVRFDFQGSLTDHITGFYASSYMDKQRNQRRWIATSKFEPTYARMAFPCFDEPAMKAMFSITVVRPTGDGYHALSNMNVESETVLGDLTEVHFAESVPMSTYLACFIVSDFAQQSKTVNGMLEGVDDFEMRVFSAAAQVDKVSYALETGVGITEYYITYFNVPYPLPKLDMAAIPDFVSGAMEHWGLVTYRETALLYDPAISSSTNKQRVATVVAHELAHMWFGNLVTMKWWNDLWLNEGFASYIEYKGVHKVHPEWGILDQFLIADLHSVMKLDATLASHAIVQTVESPDQITELFDSITYSKGASIIRMLENLVGEEKFRNATTNYLNKFIYNNAETDDFLTEIEEQEFEFDVKVIMQTWTEQTGLPVVEVSKSGNSYKLTQKRFFSNPEDYNGSHDESRFNYRWSIPITYFTSQNSEVQSVIFNHNDNEVTVTLPAAANWIKFNKNQVGYYRVNYPVEMWAELIAALVNNRGVFSNADRAHLINDAFSLADASQLNYNVALDLSLYLEKELDYVPWSVGSSRLNAIKQLLYYTDLYSEFAVYARKLLTEVYGSVTWDVGTDHLQNLLRINILNTACGFGYGIALTEASTRFTQWLSNPTNRPNPDIRTTVYKYGMEMVGNEKIWNEVWELFVGESDAQEKLKLMEALAAVKEPWILQRFINLAWDENNVRGQDYFTCLQYIAQNRVGESLVWEYVRENWPRLVERFGVNDRYLGRMIPSITSRFASQTKLEEMEAFFAKYPEAGAGTAARKEALEQVKYNIKWLQQNKGQIATWLDSQNSIGVVTTTTENTIK